ncbi:hypothetical protein CF335_g9766, partial [Tilletia laevis]
MAGSDPFCASLLEAASCGPGSMFGLAAPRFECWLGPRPSNSTALRTITI